MAQTPTTGVTPSSHAAGGFQESSGMLPENPYRSAPSTMQSTDVAPISFQAVNARKVPQNAARATPPKASSAQQPSGNSTVAPSGLQTARTPSSAQPTPPNMDSLDAAMSDPATYGTRSRNRTSNARPNYAEDMEMDFEYSSAATTTKKKASVAQGPANPDEAKHADDLAQYVATNDHAPKQSNPSTPVPTVTVPKKRKAAGAVANHLPTPPTSAAPAAVASRKSGTSASTAMARETNLMTFTKHKHRLNKKGELVADDGTKLAVNGKPTPSLFLPLKIRIAAYPASPSHECLRLRPFR